MNSIECYDNDFNHKKFTVFKKRSGCKQLLDLTPQRNCAMVKWRVLFVELKGNITIKINTVDIIVAFLTFPNARIAKNTHSHMTLIDQLRF